MIVCGPRKIEGRDDEEEEEEEGNGKGLRKAIGSLSA